MRELIVKVRNGWSMLVLTIAVWLAVPACFIFAGIRMDHAHSDDKRIALFFFIVGGLLIPLALLLTKGLFTLQPREARVLVLFGKYVGTVKEDGFHWTNPFAVHRGPLITTQNAEGKQFPNPLTSGAKYKVSLRSRNFETQKLKVNDQRGNPIEIAAVVVWRVDDTARALFEVDDYEQYVHIQSESAIRHLANEYPYDHSNDGAEKEATLRDSSDTVNASLCRELQDRLAKAGVVVEEARITHLAYAPEIAGAMLRRQQAEAVIAARTKIVHGAVSMVEMALTELSQKKVIDLDEERKAQMVSNLLVVLCGEHQAEPVINTGTLYS